MKIICQILGAFAFVLAFGFSTSFAGEKKTTSTNNGDSFQLTLSNKVYSGDPQSQFVRQSCEPNQHTGRSSGQRKSKAFKKGQSFKKTKTDG